MSWMEFTLIPSCPLKCHFCPQPLLAESYRDEGRMSLEVFEEILKKLPKELGVQFSGFAEPFINPECAFMIFTARSSGRDVSLYTTLMGLKLDLGVALLRLYPPNYTRIHVPDKKGLIIEDDKWIERHELWLKTKAQATYMAMGDPTDGIKRYMAIRGITLELPDMLSRGGNLWHPNRVINGPIRCTMNRWTCNVCMPDGSVYGCCMDYGLTVPLGNILKEEYSSIEARANEWKMRMERNATGTICSHCEWAAPA